MATQPRSSGRGRSGGRGRGRGGGRNSIARMAAGGLTTEQEVRNLISESPLYPVDFKLIT